MYSLLFLGAVAFTVSFFLTPVVRRLSLRWGAFDHRSERKLHLFPIPRVGGIAIALAYGASLALLIAVPVKAGNLVPNSLPFSWHILPAAIVIFATGLVDDLFGLKPVQKLLFEIVAAGVAFWAGVQVHVFGGHQVAPWLSLPLSVLWLVACTNAFNLIDGVDGLAAGIGLFATCTTLIAALLNNNVPLALATVPLAGALLAFLRYNFNPATIFLGDSGSLFIGFMLGCYGILWSQKSATILGMTAPVMALSIPLLDTGIAIVRRFLRQQPIFGADRGHIHHRLLDRGFTPRKVALLLYGCCFLGALCSLAMTRKDFSGPIVIIFCLVAWIGIRQLGYVEFGVVGRMFVEGSFRRLLNSHIALRILETHLMAAQTPDECWHTVRNAAKEFGFHTIDMQLAGRRFESPDDIPRERCWIVQIPISGSDYLELSREFGAENQAGTIAPFVDVLRKALAPKIAAFREEEQTSFHIAGVHSPAPLPLSG